MKYLIAAIALTIASPALAQTAPAQDHSQHSQHGQQQGGHQGHGQQQGQHGQHGQQHGQHGGHGESGHHCPCCQDRNGNGRMDCCEEREAAAQPQA